METEMEIKNSSIISWMIQMLIRITTKI